MKLRDHVGSIAAIALALFLGAFLLIDRGKVTDTERRDRAHDVFPAYRRSDIDWIELVQGSSRLRVERRPEKGDAGDTYWQMISPAEERADPAAVDRLVGDLEFAGVIRKVEEKNTPEVERGFEADRVRVTGTLSMTPLVYHFALGGPAPLPEGAAYFRVAGEGTYVVSKDFVTALLQGADRYRERSVVPYLSLDLAELAITTHLGTLDVKRKDEISFTLSESGLRASREGMDKIWGALAEARAESFLSEEDAARTLGTAPVRVVMTPRAPNKPKGEILLGDACPGHPADVVLVRVAPTREAVCVPKGAKDGLALTESSLVDARVFAARADEVEELSFETVPPQLTVDLARKGHGWHERKPNDRELSSTEVDVLNELVTKLTRGEADKVTRVDTKAPTNVRARVRLHRGGAGAGVEEIVDLLGNGLDEARRAFDNANLHVPTSLGRRLVPSEIVFRDHLLFTGALEGRNPTALRTHCDGVRQSLFRDGANWRMREPSGYAADELAAADVAALFRNAQVSSWIADRDDGTYGLGASTCGLDLDASHDGGDGGGGGLSSFGIVFGNATEGGFFAKTTTDGAVFLAPKALRDTAQGWLIDRSGFRADAASILRATLSRGHGAIPTVLTPHLHPTSDPDASVDSATEARRTRALDTLSTLRPDAAIHLGPPKPNEGFGAPSLDVRVKLAGDASAREIHFVLGDAVFLERQRMVYLRLDGVDATFAIARERVAALLDAD